MTRILVVEGGPIKAEEVRLVLEEGGFEVETARDGQEGREKLEVSTFDLVVSDIVLPRLSGFELCQWMRSDARTSEVPIILLTALNDPMDIIQALEAGADSFISQPCDPDYLLARIRNILENRRLKSEHRLSVNVEMQFMGRRLIVGSGKEQILGLLLSAFEDIVRKDREQVATQAELSTAKEKLEEYAGQLESRVRTTEEMYGTLMREASDAIFVAGADGVLTEVNRQAASLLGRPAAEIVGRTLSDFVISAGGAGPEQLRKWIEREGRLRCDVVFARPDGTKVETEMSVSVVDVQRRVLELGIARDVAGRRRAERRAAAQREVTRVLAESSSLAEAAPRLLRAICDTLGWDRGVLWQAVRESAERRCLGVWDVPSSGGPDLTPSPFAVVFDPDGVASRVWEGRGAAWIPDMASEAGVPRAGAAPSEGLRAGAGFPIVSDGQIHGVVELFSRETRQPDDELLGALSSFGNQIGQFVERRRAEETSRESEARFRGIFEQVRDVVFTIGPDRICTSASPSLEETTGWRPSEVIGGRLKDLLHPDDLPAAFDAFARSISGQSPPPFDVRVLRKSGGYLDMDLSVTPMRRGDQIELLGIARDITNRKRADRELRESEEKFAAAFHASPNLMAVTRVADGTILEVNESYSRLLGHTRAESIGKTTTELSIWADPADRAAFIASLKQSGQITEFETTLRRKDGTLVTVIDSARTIQFQGETCVLSIAHDITERQRTEQDRLAHLRFFESMDQVNRAIQGSNDLEQLMKDVLGTVLSIFACDRAWLLHPCDPDAPSFRVPMEITRAEYPGAKVLNVDVPMSPGEARSMREALESDAPVTYTAGTDRPISTAKQFGVQSQMFTPLRPRSGKAWVFGMHQCSYPRVWTAEEKRLFQEISRRLADALTSLLTYRDLQESEKRYRRIVDTASEGIWMLGPDTLTTFANARMAEMLGYSGEEMNGRPLTDFMFEEDVPDHLRRLENRHQGLSEHYERRFRRRDGQTVWTLASAAPLFDDEHRFNGSFGMFTDVTERRRAEEQLRKASAYSRSLIEASLDPLVTISPDGKITDVNIATEAVTGRPRADLIGSDFADYFTEPEQAREGYRTALASREVRNYPLTIRDVSGRTIDVLYNASVYSDEAGQVQGVFAAARDVSERKRAESVRRAAYQISEAAQNAGGLDEFFRRAHEIVSDLIPTCNFYVALLDPETGMLRFPYFVDELDRQPAPKRLGRGLTEYVIRTGEPLLASADVFDDLVARGEVDLIGSPSIDWIGVPLKTPRGTIGAAVVQTYTAGVRFSESDKDFLSFISGQLAMAIQRKRAEEVLRESEAELREAQRVAHVGSWSWIIETDTMTWSEELFRIAGRDPADPAPNYSTGHLTLYAPESLARLRPLVERTIRTGEPYEADLELIRPDGTTRWIANTGEARRDAKGQIVGLRGTAEDFTEQRRLREQLLQSQKMEAIGRLAGGIAHDFNNLLTVIGGYSEVLLNSLPEGELEHRHVTEIGLAARRATALTRQLLTFSRKHAVDPKVLDVNTIMSGILGLLNRLLGEDVEIVLELQKGLGLVKADPGQIEQVIMNLAVNARDAMPQGGKLILETQDVELDESYARAHPSVAAGPYVLLAASDTGCGMTPETVSHVFEPFFTTKEVGKGTGLGLSTVFGIVKQSGGAVGVTSVPGEGTTFKIYLPRVTAATGERELASSPAIIRARPGDTVLLVEDDETVRRLTHSMLSDLGYEVLAAARGAEALEIATRHPRPVDLLLTDVMMPGMNGPEVAQRFLALRPEARVVFMSGYAEEAILDRAAAQARAVFLQKPFAFSSLGRKLREALDAVPLPGPMGEKGRVPEEQQGVGGHGDRKPLSILQMDDDTNVLELTRFLLAKDGHRVTSCLDVQETVARYAEALARGERFDLVILDLSIPGRSGGVEGMREILELDPTARIVACSGAGPSASGPLESGFVASVEKPFTSESLKAILPLL